MSESDGICDAKSPVRSVSETAYISIERHANRIVIAAGLIFINLVAVEVIRNMIEVPRLATVFTVLLELCMLLLVYRLAVRSLRFAVGSARHHARLSQAMMNAVAALSNDPAGVAGTANTLTKTAREAGCEVLMWDASNRTLIADGDECHPLTAAMARALSEAVQTRRVVRVPDVDVCGFLPGEVLRSKGTQACIVAPMWVGDEFVGLVVRRYADVRQMLYTQGASLVSGFAALGSVSIGKAQIVDREHRRALDTEILLKSVHLVDEASASDQLDCFAREAAGIIGGTVSAILSVSGGMLHIVGTSGIDHAQRSRAAGLSIRSELVEQRLARSPGTRVVTVASLSRDCRELLTGLGISSTAVIHTIKHDTTLVGLLVVDGNGMTEIPIHTQSMVAAVVRQVAASMERRRTSRTLRKRSRHLACTPKLARSLTGLRDIRTIARIASRELHDGFGYGRVSLAIADEAGQLRIMSSSGMLAQSSVQIVTTPVLESAYRSVLPYVSCIAESSRGAQGARIADLDAPAGCRSQIVVPICDSNHECLGVIAVYERDPDALGEDDLHMLQTIAEQVGAVLEQAALFDRLERNYFKTVEALSAALEAKDAYTLSHAQSITDMTAAVGRRMGMTEREITDLKLGALLHDIGKIGVPSDILNKQGPLNDDEFEVMKTHTIVGEQIIAPIEFLNEVRPMVLHEHERWDGAGYPHGLAGSDIPLGARIIFVCDAYHAMTSDRPYRQALPLDEARMRLRRSAGTQFDPQIVEAFCEAMDAGEFELEPELVFPELR